MVHIEMMSHCCKIVDIGLFSNWNQRWRWWWRWIVYVVGFEWHQIIGFTVLPVNKSWDETKLGSMWTEPRSESDWGRLGFKWQILKWRTCCCCWCEYEGVRVLATENLRPLQCASGNELNLLNERSIQSVRSRRRHRRRCCCRPIIYLSVSRRRVHPPTRLLQYNLWYSGISIQHFCSYVERTGKKIKERKRGLFPYSDL